ncbi:MAG: hypothetical protein NT051_04690 [Candidatus Micrarchaeota archaeon]|nr:hypothetical protein [Candidatus Micrarchaeota archaeon]
MASFTSYQKPRDCAYEKKPPQGGKLPLSLEEEANKIFASCLTNSIHKGVSRQNGFEIRTIYMDKKLHVRCTNGECEFRDQDRFCTQVEPIAPAKFAEKNGIKLPVLKGEGLI